MYVRWSNTSLKRAIQITRNLSKVCKRLQVQVQLTRQEILQAKRELDELKTMSEVPGAIDMYQKYAALLKPYLQSRGVDSPASVADDPKIPW